jgi:hypothetical protein
MIFRRLILLNLLLSSLALPALASENKGTVVLLTSLNLTSAPFWKEYWRTYHLKLEDKLREEFADQPYKIKTIHYAKQDDLWDVLHNPENIAVFWVSHSGFDQSQIIGIADFAAVVDEFGYDLAPIFQKAHANLQFLGVIGCLSEKVLKVKPNSIAEVVSFDSKIDPVEGLEKAMARAKEVLNPERKVKGLCEYKKVFPIAISRKIPLEETEIRHPPVRVMNGKKVLGVFPVGFPGDVQTLVVSLESIKNLNLQISAGSNPGLKIGEIGLGKFEFSTGNVVHTWKLFSKNGVPIGISTYAFDYVGPGVSHDEVVNIVSCVP